MAQRVENTAQDVRHELSRFQEADTASGHFTAVSSNEAGSPAFWKGPSSDVNPPEETTEVAGTVGDPSWSAVPAREVSRRLVELTTEEEYRDLLDRRAVLVKRQLEERLSRSEELELQLVRWSLDRIDDAKYGRELDFLERIAEAQEYLASRISNSLEQLGRLAKPKRRRTR